MLRAIVMSVMLGLACTKPWLDLPTWGAGVSGPQLCVGMSCLSRPTYPPSGGGDYFVPAPGGDYLPCTDPACGGVSSPGVVPPYCHGGYCELQRPILPSGASSSYDNGPGTLCIGAFCDSSLGRPHPIGGGISGTIKITLGVVRRVGSLDYCNGTPKYRHCRGCVCTNVGWRDCTRNVCPSNILPGIWRK